MNTYAPIAPSSSLEREITRFRQLAGAGRHDDALALIDGPLTAFPENRDLLLLKAVCERHARRIEDAFATLDRLADHQPRFSLMHQERGLCHVARKDAAAAIESLLSAVNINPALPMSWHMLEGIYRLVGDGEKAKVAAGHSSALRSLPDQIVQATSLFSDGDLAPAEDTIRSYLLRNGDHPEAMRLLAKIGVARDVLDDAELLFEAVLTLVPGHRAARREYAQCLIDRHRYADARAQLRQLLADDPDDRDLRALAAAVAVGLGEHERAIAIYRELLTEAPAAADIHLWLGHAQKTIGVASEAVAAYRAAAKARPDFGDAYWSLANLKRYRFEDDEIARMRAAEAAPGTMVVDRLHLCFALGKALEDGGEFAASWDFYARGNALQREQSRYRPEILETNTRRQREVCTAGFFAARAGWGVTDADPIFIVGLPRSGSTLIEQILASHSQVEGTQELPDVQRIVHDLQGHDPDLDDPRYPGVLADLDADEIGAFARRYLDDTRAYRTDRPFFIDKMPNNFRHIGLIHLMLPNARIIDARRDPMSCCFSNLKQLFARGQEFAYSIDDIARYYRTYLDLMRHWDAALPGRVLRIRHEDVVDDLEGSVARILDHVGLPFERNCVEFHRSTRSVRTPSSEQVRQPIFRDGLDQWRNYEPWLDPLKDALGDALTRCRD